jgi:ATP-binding cassette subfamily C protein
MTGFFLRSLSWIPGNVASVLAVMTPKQRWRFAQVLLLQCLSNFTELLLLGLMVPLIAVVSDPGFIGRSNMLSAQMQLANASNPNQVTLVLCTALLALLAIRAAVAFWLTAVQHRTLRNLSADLAGRVLSALLRLPYLQYAATNTSILQRKAISNVDRLISLSLVAAITWVSELVTTGAIVVGLLVIAPEVMGPLILVLGGASYLVYATSRRLLADAGDVLHRQQSEMVKWTMQSLGDIRYGRLVGAENFFVDRTRAAWHRYSNAVYSLYSIQIGTRVLIDGGALGTVILLVIFFIATDAATSTILPVLSLLAVATLRLVPAMARIVGASQTLRHYQTGSDEVADTLRAQAYELTPDDVTRIKFSHQIDVSGLKFTYPGKKKPALAVSGLSIKCGQMVGIVGASGAGKSTLVDILCGLIPPDEGSVRVDGVDIQSNLPGWHRSIGYVPQMIYLLDDTIRANVAFAVEALNVDEKAVQRAIEAACLSSFTRSLPLGLETVVGERGIALSGGQRQRIAIARALYHDPAVLVLDEATSSLDVATEKAITETLNNLYGRKTVVIIAHRLNTVRACDCLYLLREGLLIAQGTYDELQAGNACFRELAGGEMAAMEQA